MAGSDYHLCFVNSIRTWGGAEVWVLDTALALRRLGHRVSLVAQPDSQLLRRARALGVPAASIAIRLDAAPWTIAKLARYFSTGGVTAVVANLTKDLKASAVAARLAGIKIILGSRESDFPLKDKLYYRAYFNRLATGLLVNSRATRRTVLSSAPWLDPATVHLLYKGIDTDLYCPGERPVLPPVIGFVGQLIHRKGISDIMAAWSMLDGVLAKPDSPDRDPVLRLIGEGSLADELAAWRRTLRRPGQVEILGYQENIAEQMRRMTLLIMPSWSEGFGLAAAEAGASGLPVIASNVSSLPEIVVDGQTGLLVPPGNPQDLSAAIMSLLSQPGRLVRLGQAARAHVVEKFSRQRCLDRLLQLTRTTSSKG